MTRLGFLCGVLMLASCTTKKDTDDFSLHNVPTVSAQDRHSMHKKLDTLYQRERKALEQK
jgi:hypothetical protein